ncbi:hypothetical protein CYMTET_30049 [Cymbomonas tetramitiformis]|uniref:Uncharacterized protein n=1 Tax=Cymbomonas tetramitiformis TaxID=36881 RepID=A0AAE0FJM1_9CHLO|nr:hypothetical protein CYMTET_30049 [Cymbomonas tetramitiformis]
MDGGERDVKYGRFAPEDTYNVDQVPLEDEDKDGRTYDDTNASDVHVKSANPSNSGTPRFGRDVTQPRLAIIFAGSGKKISKWEKEQYDKRVDVYFQRNAWADLLFTCEWAERTWRKHREEEGVQVNKKRKIVVPEGGELAVASQAVATAGFIIAEACITAFNGVVVEGRLAPGRYALSDLRMAMWEGEVGDMLHYPVRSLIVTDTDITVEYLPEHWSVEQLQNKTPNWGGRHDDVSYVLFRPQTADLVDAEMDDADEDDPCDMTDYPDILMVADDGISESSEDEDGEGDLPKVVDLINDDDELTDEEDGDAEMPSILDPVDQTASVPSHLRPAILWHDRLGSQVDEKYRRQLRVLSNTTAEYGEADCTDLVQVVDDSRVENQLKTYVKEERNTFLESSDTAFDEWEFASASHKRIMYTHWCGDAYEKLITEKNHNINQAYIDKGMTLAADGSEDHLLKLKGLEDMEFPKERPAAPPPRLSKKERREKAIAQAIEANTSFSSVIARDGS